ncbi:nucleolar protein 9 [Drosophila guanche]|uniref:Blast:Nucleolar protein 9 n=1 Tax=Drosophila guanche TaxID=7266 RepID=A0A3B0JD43_DROGU|nr:nucleolar protein 9 [Drosophila guanche]SPP73140.1 blast:Nucleolar protein 9 [Drosophila guanche]
MQTEGNAKRKRPKKKGNRFMRNAKGFAKQGIFGRGTHIDDEQFSYFINILDAMKAGFEDVEERVNMANNVFEQTKEQEIHLASNQIVSKALESLIGFVDSEQLERYFNTFGDSLRPLCSDRFASHVLQKMLEIAFLRGLGKAAAQEVSDAPTTAKKAKPDAAQIEEEYNLETEFSDDHREKCRQFVVRISKFMLNNLEDFVWDTCASHIMRTAILCLVGMHVPKIAFEKGGAEMAKHRKLYTVPEDWREVMKEFPQRLEMWPQFVDFPYQEHSSALLGVICLALSVADKSLLKHFGKKILVQSLLKPNEETENDEEKKDTKIEIKDDDEEEKEKEATPTEEKEQSEEKPAEDAPVLPKVFHHQSAVILLETILSVAGAKLLTQLYAMLFSGRVGYLAKQQGTNFAVQRLLQHIKEVTDFEAVFTELQPQVEELLKMGYTGVVSALSAACLRLGAKQAQMIAVLQSSLHVSGGDKEKAKLFFNCLIKLKPFEVLASDESGFVHLHGSLIAQHVLQFNKPIFLVNCILDLPAAQLAQIFNTPNGSHIVDAFMQSKFIGEKSRERLIRQLDGFYVDLAITRHGSRVLEECFKASQEAQKLRIAKELTAKSNMLKGSPFGRLLYAKYRLETFNLSPTQWQASLAKQLEPEQPGTKRKPVKTAAEAFKDILS